MFSSIASFLPSALHLNTSGSPNIAVLDPTDNPAEEEAYRLPVEEDVNAKKIMNTTKTRSANEVNLNKNLRMPEAKPR